ncbi:hypothetical protein ACFLY0_01835 [Patescibacteria group bacterium]
MTQIKPCEIAIEYLESVSEMLHGRLMTNGGLEGRVFIQQGSMKDEIGTRCECVGVWLSDGTEKVSTEMENALLIVYYDPSDSMIHTRLSFTYHSDLPQNVCRDVFSMHSLSSEDLGFSRDMLNSMFIPQFKKAAQFMPSLALHVRGT